MATYSHFGRIWAHSGEIGCAEPAKYLQTMITTKLYLDARGIKGGGEAPLKLSISHKGKTALISLGVKVVPSQWDSRACKVIAHPNKAYLNMFITKRKQDIDVQLLKLAESGSTARLSATEIKKRVLEELNPDSDKPQGDLFAARFLRFADSKKGNTKDIYKATYKKMLAYDDALPSLSFEDITKEWLTGFDTFMQRTSPSKNARNIHLRNIRAVFNDAIDDEVTSFYPFRKFKIRPVKTAKRSLPVEQLRLLFGIEVEEHERKYLDMFKLIFFLVGINVADLCKLEAIKDGRIEYYRAKTGRFYSIKVEPEALEIINRYRGQGQLLDIMDRYANYRGYAKRLNDNLQRIGNTEVGKRGKKTFHPLFPSITTYWARHSWATIAASLDIPKETIAAALGHGGNTVTDIYIDFDMRNVNAANRKVMDYVLQVGEYAKDSPFSCR